MTDLGVLHDARRCMPAHFTAFYDGQFQEPIDGQYFDTFSPGDGKVVGKVAFAGVKDTEAALQAAQRACAAWATVPPLDRANLLRRVAGVLREHATELATLDALNTGSPITTMKGDAYAAADQIEFFAGMIPAVTGDTHDVGQETFNYTIREPLGVVARIVASNHPLMFTACKLAAPLAMGNTVVIKPPEQAPLSALRLMELIGDIFPRGVLNVLAGGADCGRALSTHPLVNKITLIGSAPVGRAIQRAAADTLKLSLFELGGKNALVAYPDAEIERLVNGVVAGMNWAWCGQSCGSTSRVFLHETIHDDVLRQVARKLEEKFRPGNPLHSATTMGSMVSKTAQDRVLKYIDSAKQEGARLVIGGGPPVTADTVGGYFVEPTIFADVEHHMTVAREEIFGPVLSVLKWEDEDEMFEQVNDVEYGLTGAVFTSNIGTMQRAVRNIQSGTVWVNMVGTHFLGMPFGGYKQSGIGKEECLEELYGMTQCKAVHVKL